MEKEIQIIIKSYYIMRLCFCLSKWVHTWVCALSAPPWAGHDGESLSHRNTVQPLQL